MNAWAFLARYKHVTAGLLLVLLAACLYGLFQLRPDETIHALLPASARGQVELF